MNIYDISNEGSSVPVLDQSSSEYPNKVNIDELKHMELVAESEYMNIHFFPYLRENPDNHAPYLDIYAFDTAENDYFRFVIVSGYRLDEEEEEAFSRLLRNNNTIFHVDSDFVEDVIDSIPEYTVPEREKDDLPMFIERCYWIANPSGIKHMLYLKSFNYISFHLDDFEALNLIGDTIEEVFGLSEDIMKLYSYSKYGYYNITDSYERKRLARYYEEFGEEFSKRGCGPGYYQCLYLDDLLVSKEDGHENGAFPSSFSSILYDYLEEVDDMEEYIDLVEYAWLAYELSEFVDHKRGLHSNDQLFDETTRLKRVDDVLQKTLTYDEIIRDKSEEYEYLEDHHYGQYQFILPHSVKEYLKLADQTHKSLVSQEYLKRIAEGECLILFVRCRDNKNSFAIEIHLDEEGPLARRDDRVDQIFIGYCLRRRDIDILEDYFGHLHIYFNKSCFFCSCLE